MTEIEANYSQSEGRAVGGKIVLGQDSLVFEPNKLDELTGGEEIEIAYEDIREVGKKGRFEEGLKDTLYGGGMRKRLKIETESSNEFWFVVSSLGDVVDTVDRYAREGGGAAGRSEAHSDGEVWNPRFPILSVFAALLIARSGFFSLTTAGNPVEGFVLLLLAILIVPRIRKGVDGVVKSATGLSLRSKLFQIVTGLVYALLVAVSVLLLIGEAVRDPTMSAATGLVSVVVPFVLAVVIVSVLRLVR
jgi:hypothetical protein